MFCVYIIVKESKIHLRNWQTYTCIISLLLLINDILMKKNCFIWRMLIAKTLNIFWKPNNYCSSCSETKDSYELCERSFHIRFSHLHNPTNAPLPITATWVKHRLVFHFLYYPSIQSYQQELCWIHLALWMLSVVYP